MIKSVEEKLPYLMIYETLYLYFISQYYKIMLHSTVNL